MQNLGLEPGVDPVGNRGRGQSLGQLVANRLGIDRHVTNFDFPPMVRVFERVDRDGLLVVAPEFLHEVGEQSVLLQGSKGIGDCAVELIEILFAGHGLAKLLESGKFRLRRRLFLLFQRRLFLSLFRRRLELFPHGGRFFAQRFGLGQFGNRIPQIGPQLLQRFDVLG